MRASSFTTTKEQPYGRRLGRTLDPLDYKEGWPSNGVVLVGAFALDDNKAKLAQERAAAEAKAAAIAQSKAKIAAANAAKNTNQPNNAAPPPAVAVQGDSLSVEGAKASIPYMVIAGVITIVIAHFIFKVG